MCFRHSTTDGVEGTGAIDAYQLLMQIEGTRAVHAGQDQVLRSSFR